MKNLQQEKYEDDNGTEILSSEVQVLAPYIHHADGFYQWTCGACQVEHGDRWHNISGRVLVCPNCGKKNLLVRTNCSSINDLAKHKFLDEDRIRELERLKGVEKYNLDERDRLKRELLDLVEKAIRSHPAFEKRYGTGSR